MIDKAIIGKTFPSFCALAEAGQLRFFAKAIGEDDPVYFDEIAAREAGHPTIPLPPTFIFSLELARPPSHGSWREEAGVEISRILHGEQHFSYHQMAYAGDTLHFESRITDVYDKKQGALTFIVQESKVSNQHGEHIADIRKSLVHRNV